MLRVQKGLPREGTAVRDSPPRKDCQMIGYEEYLRKNPQVSIKRVEKILSDGSGLFLKNKHDLALFPRNSSTDELVCVDLTRMTCECNVFRTKKACPHVAAALAKVEMNEGKVPYTDPVEHVHARLEWLKNAAHYPYLPSLSDLFLRDVKPFLSSLPTKEKSEFVLQLGYCLQIPESNLTRDTFINCYYELMGYDRKIGELLFRNRHECLNAVVALMHNDYHCPFSEEEKNTILKEIAADEALSAKYLPSLAGSYSSFFSRRQLLDYYRSLDDEKIIPYQMSQLLNRLLEEDPPLYEDYLDIVNSSSLTEYFDIDLSAVRKIIQAGYSDRLGKLTDCIVSKIRSIDDYFKVISLIPHDRFLIAWKNSRNNGKFRNHW